MLFVYYAGAAVTERGKVCIAWKDEEGNLKETFTLESSLKQKMSGNKFIYCSTFFECCLTPNFSKTQGENDQDVNLKDF